MNFYRGVRTRGLTPIYNLASGNGVFKSLAQIVFGDASKFELMRHMIVHRMQSFPKKYNRKIHDFPTYCTQMSMYGKPASPLELQVAADIFLSVVELYANDDFQVPYHTIRPERLYSESKSYIRLWMHGSHCVALIDKKSKPQIQNVQAEEETRIQIMNSVLFA